MDIAVQCLVQGESLARISDRKSPSWQITSWLSSVAPEKCCTGNLKQATTTSFNVTLIYLYHSSAIRRYIAYSADKASLNETIKGLLKIFVLFVCTEYYYGNFYSFSQRCVWVGVEVIFQIYVYFIQKGIKHL
jgi:hypothetical protein